MKKTQNKGYYAIQGHSKSSRSVPIGSPYAISYYWLIVTDIISRTVLELSQLIVRTSDTLRFWAPPPSGGRDNVRCSSWVHWKALSGLPISANWTFSLGVKAEALRAKIDRKSAISLQRGHFDPKFQVEGVAHINHICTDSQYNECLTTFSLTVFIPKTFVADFLEAKCEFTTKTAVLRFWAPFWRRGRCLGTTYDDHLRLVVERVVDYLLVSIKLFSLGVTAEMLRANVDWKTAFLKRWVSFRQIFTYIGASLPTIFARIWRPLNALQLCRWRLSHKETL